MISWLRCTKDLFFLWKTDVILKAQQLAGHFVSTVLQKTSLEIQYRERQMKQACRWHALWVKTLMGVLFARTLKSIYIIADRLSPNIDWSGFSIYFSLCSLATDSTNNCRLCDCRLVWHRANLPWNIYIMVMVCRAIVHICTLSAKTLQMLSIFGSTSKKSFECENKGLSHTQKLITQKWYWFLFTWRPNKYH